MNSTCNLSAQMLLCSMMKLNGGSIGYRTCDVEGCNRKHYGKGFCSKHYMRFRRYGDINCVKIVRNMQSLICSVYGCGRRPHAKNLCSMHYYRKKNTGELLTEKEKMWIKAKPNQIPLTNGKYAIVDKQDFEELNKFIWSAANYGGIWYAFRYENKTTVKMHRMILKPPKGMVVDHINHNGLDNRRQNIRICTHAENSLNKRKSKRKSKSKYKGITWNNIRQKWEVFIFKDKKRIFIASFENEEDAALQYNIAAKLFYGEFAYLNDV